MEFNYEAIVTTMQLRSFRGLNLQTCLKKLTGAYQKCVGYYLFSSFLKFKF